MTGKQRFPGETKAAFPETCLKKVTMRDTPMMEQNQEPEKQVRTESGKIYFSREGERLVFFLLTLIMVVIGICTKIGWF
jgi:hypothetical protein